MKRFVDLKEGDEVFVISDGECLQEKSPQEDNEMDCRYVMV